MNVFSFRSRLIQLLVCVFEIGQASRPPIEQVLARLGVVQIIAEQVGQLQVNVRGGAAVEFLRTIKGCKWQ